MNSKTRSKMSAQDSEGQKQSKDMENLKSKSAAELKELLDRHQNILSKSRLVANLPDKGENLMLLKSRVENELASRAHASAAVDHVANSLSSVQLNCDALEWNATETSPALSAETDVKPNDPLFSFIQGTSRDRTFDPYVDKLCQKYWSPAKTEPQTSKYLPHQTTISSSHLPPKTGFVTQLPITDSLLLEKKQSTFDVTKGASASVLANWRMIATLESESEEEEETESARLQLQEEDQEDPPELP